MITYKEAKEELDHRCAGLTAYDFHPNSTVTIVHDEGSFLSLRNAFYEEWKDGWLFVFTEHLGHMCFHTGDLAHYYCSEQVYEETSDNKEEEER
jgi:hypothetical protein